MKKISFIFLISLLFSIFSVAKAVEVNLIANPVKTPVAVASGPVFTRNLTVGMLGQDVLALKKILGLEVGVVDTQNTFNSITKGGVMKLQDKYAIELLIPLGLSTGTGFVGPSTIMKLNKLAASYNIKLSDFPNVDVTIKEVFTINLSLGSINDQVKLLKSVLNSEVGAKLELTTTFDQATKDAVIKFQEKYASEILTPNGLAFGNGFVGASSRKKLNSILKNSLAPVGTASISATAPGTVGGTVQGQTTSGQTTTGTVVDINLASKTICPIYSYSYGDWGPCSDSGIQTRTVTETKVGEATCPYKNITKQSNTQYCTPPPVPECPSDQAIYVGGEVGTMASCELYGNVLVMKAGTKYTTENGLTCNYTKNRLISMNPFTAGILAGTGYYNAPADLKVIGKVLPSTYFCFVMGADSGNWRMLDISNSQIKIQP